MKGVSCSLSVSLCLSLHALSPSAFGPLPPRSSCFGPRSLHVDVAKNEIMVRLPSHAEMPGSGILLDSSVIFIDGSA